MEFTSDDDDETDEIDHDKKSKNINYFKMASAIGKIRSYGVFIEKPDINKSLWTFKPNVDENKIYFGLKGISKINNTLIETIINNRPYTSLMDFLDKVKVNKPQATMLIKAGAFDALHPNETRFDLLYQYSVREADTKKRLTLQNMSALINYNILPETLNEEKIIYALTKHMRKHCRDNGLFILNEVLIPHIEKLDFDGIYYNDNNQEYIIEKEWDKYYKRKMELVKDWIASEPESLNNLNQAIINELYQKYAPNNIPQGEMESLSFYYGEHELDLEREWLRDLQVVNFFDLPNEPEIEWESTNSNAKKYKLYRIAGTCVGRDKTKKMVGFLTPEGSQNCLVIQ